MRIPKGGANPGSCEATSALAAYGKCALSLEFKMGGELLRTVIVRDWEELLILGAVILLRAAMTFLIHWEITIETKREREKIEEKSAENAAKGK